VRTTLTSWFVQVLGFVGLQELYYAGSHGMDIRGSTADLNNHGKVK
jgi:trehalose 6-phosphate phosphatase